MPRVKRRPESWTGQIGMDVGEQRLKSELEGSVQKRITSALEALGVKVIRRQVGLFKTMHGTYTRVGEVGEADLECQIFPATVFYVETKRGKGGIITDEQRAWVAEKRRMGFVAGFASTVDEAVRLWEEARKQRAA